ncbi:uncharacterized protein [Montipora capricornis]|uniref:uncharacterized protein n=1 Tax=Montipora capricornis TaxID=246305 RepID=UPI0035F127A8
MTALLKQEVSGCLLFTGDVDHLIPVHNWDLLDDGAFITAGKAVAHSVLHGGQGFIWMSPAVVAYIETHDLDKALISTCIEDVPDIDFRETISLILTSTKDQLPNLRIQNPAVLDLLDDCGVVNLQEDNRHKAVQKILLQQVIIKRKNEIEDIMKGMDSLSLLSFLKSHPCISPLVFTKKTEATPSVEEVQNLIVAEDNTSLTGSQERALDFLKAYVANLGSRAEGNSFCPDALTPLQEFIHFCTGTNYIPSYLGERKISVGFARDPRAIHPKANTCFWKLQLLTCYTSFPAFTESFDKCIEIEGRGFMTA